MADRREAAARKLQKSYFDVLGLCCSSEIPRIENALKQLDGVKDVTIIIASRTVIVVHDSLLVSPSQIVNALNQERLEANIKVSGGSHHQNKWPSPYAVASGALLIISFFKYFYHPLRWFALGAVAAGIFPVARKGLAAIRSCRIDINVLVLIAVGGTIAMKDYWEAGTIVFLFIVAEWLESRASYKASAEMSSLMSIAPQKAVIAETGEVVDVDEVKLNTVVAVKAGEVIPIDGIVVDGRSEVDEKTLTGESFPVSKQKDSIVLAGTINLNGYISVKTTALAEECVVSKMAKLVEEAQNKKSRTQRIIDKWTKFYTPAIVGAAIGLAVIPVILRAHNRSYWFHLALVVLVSACPCALVLSTPVATFCALTKAAKSGVLIKGGDYLETLGGIRCVAFDKTGTITKGEFVVADFQSLPGDISLETLLYWVSSIESKSNHPLAAPLVQYAKSRGIEPKPEDVQEFQNFPGEGICGKIDGKDIFVGNKKIAIKAGGEIAPSSKGKTKGGKTVGYVFAGATLVGTFSLSDECRSGVIQAVKELKSMKIKTAMLTGDNQEAAFHAQNQIDNALDLVHAELLPEDKSKIIETLKKDGLTIMVGDGINDAPALATADIGISMGISGSALAVETGHVVLMSNDIRKIPQVIRLARRARWTVIQNVILSIATKVAILGLAIAGHPLIWAAVIADVGTCLVVISNSMLLLRGQHKNDHGHCHGHGHGHGKGHEFSHAPKENKCCSKSIVSSQKHQHCGDGDLLHGSKHCGKGNKCNSGNTQHSNHSHHHHCKQESRAEKVSCESRSCSLKEQSAPKKASSELGNCISHERCTQTCHSIQTKDVSSSAKKQECCSGISKLCGTKQCEAGLSDNVSHLMEMCNEKHGCLVGDTSNGSHTHDIQETVARQDEKNFHSHEEHGVHRSQCVSKHSECLNTSAHNGHCHQSHDCGENHTRSSGDCSELDNTEIGIESGRPGYQQTTSAHACCSLEKREIGGCCKSYMEECCGKHHGHLGHGFGGNLTEIVIE